MENRKKALIVATIPITIKSFYLQVADKLKESDIDVTFSYSKGAEANNISNLGYDAKIIPISRKPFHPGNIFAILSLATYMLRNRTDIVETTTPVASVVGRLAALIARVPLRINTIRGLFPKDTHRYQSTLFDLVERVLSSRTTLTVTINSEDRQQILSKKRRDPNSVIILPCGGCGVDLKAFDKSTYTVERINAIRSQLSVGEEEFIVTFIGRLARDKGIFDLIELARMLKDYLTQFKVIIVGEAFRGEHISISSDHLRAYICKEGMNTEVIVTGLREDIPAIIAASDVIVLPSYREGFGIVLAEAAAMGKPTVAYTNAGTREVIDPGETGILVEKGDIRSMACAIAKIAEDADMYNTMSISALKKARREFNIEAVIEEYRRIYLGLLDGQSTSSK